MIRPKNPYRKGTKRAEAFERGVSDGLLAVIEDLRRVAATAHAADVPTLRAFLVGLADDYKKWEVE